MSFFFPYHVRSETEWSKHIFKEYGQKNRDYTDVVMGLYSCTSGYTCLDKVGDEIVDVILQDRTSSQNGVDDVEVM